MKSSTKLSAIPTPINALNRPRHITTPIAKQPTDQLCRLIRRPYPPHRNSAHQARTIFHRLITLLKHWRINDPTVIAISQLPFPIQIKTT
jgi:hypothetical protein